MSSEYAELKNKALNLLARREHSENELRFKLSQKLDDGESKSELISQIIQELIDLGYLSDERYVEMMIRSRFAKGQGPMRVRQALKQFKVDESLIQSKFEEFDGDWFESAVYVRQKKFGDDTATDAKERARQMRYLASRGFSTDQIYHALEADSPDY